MIYFKMLTQNSPGCSDGTTKYLLPLSRLNRTRHVPKRFLFRNFSRSVYFAASKFKMFRMQFLLLWQHFEDVDLGFRILITIGLATNLFIVASMFFRALENIVV